MIRKLRIKIVAVVLGSLLIVFAAVIVVLNSSVSRAAGGRIDEAMERIAENDGFVSIISISSSSPDGVQGEGVIGIGGGPPDTAMMMRSGRFFYVKVDQGGNIIEANLDMMFDFSYGNAAEYAEAALKKGRAEGSLGNYVYLVREKNYGKIVVFAERSIELWILDRLTKISLLVAGVTGLALFGLAFFLARWMTAPVKTTLEKQRRFISDASHELKTPLTVISANADVLENEIGGNRRLTQIKFQTGRMGELIRELLTLAKADEGRADFVKSEFALSDAVLGTTLEFESMAFEEGKAYSFDVTEGLTYVGDEAQIKRLSGILIDNAIKHSDERGRINVTLDRDGARINLSVFNTGVGVPDADRGKLFDRFYRSDESRSRETGGYGLGLSIAKSIVDEHKGKRFVTGKYGEWTRFTVLL
jgi:signal transduction histidine kinase